MLGSVRSKLVSNYQGYSTKSRAGLLLQGLSLEIGWSSWRFCTSGFNINGSDDAKSRHSKVQQNGRGGFCELAATSQKTSMFQCSSVDIAAMVTRQRRSSMAHARVLDKMGSAWSSFATFFRRGFEPRNLPLGWNEDFLMWSRQCHSHHPHWKSMKLGIPWYTPTNGIMLFWHQVMVC